MIIKLDKQIFVDHLQLIQGAVELRLTIPILSNVLIDAKKSDQIEIRSTNLEMGIRTNCPADIERKGSITVAAKKIYEIARSLPEGVFHLTVDENSWVHIDSKNTKFKIVGLPVDEFPDFPQFDQEKGCAVSFEAFKGMIERSIFAVSADENPYNLRGAKVVLSEEKMTMVATDGHRLTYVDVPRKVEGSKNLKEVVLPRKLMQEVVKLKVKEGEKLVLGVEKNFVFVKHGGTVLSSKMLEKDFPEYRKVFEEKPEYRSVLKVQELRNALRRVAILSSERAKAVKFDFTQENLKLSSTNPEVGEAEEIVDHDYKGEEASIKFNPEYIIDFLEVVGTEEVEFLVRDGDFKGLLKPSGESGYEYSYIVMPMRM